MAHYVGVFVPRGSGGWRALFPDVPECTAEGESLDQTIFLAANALAESKQAFNGTFPAPRNLTEIKEDNGWASAFGIDWSRAVINMIPLRAGQK
jgi:predicted RNase H-like HicB family nuclease